MIFLATNIVIKGVLRELDRRMAAGEDFTVTVSTPAKVIGYEVVREWRGSRLEEAKWEINEHTGQKTVYVSRRSEEVPAIRDPAYRHWPWMAQARLLTFLKSTVPKEPIIIDRCAAPGATYREIMAAINALPSP